ncbi:unnamed protein product [Medioppia subpectinata]|uniref:Cytochrome P450 n=1 Tax=Medioppia subpectinata TaxID=1979941 RepID=A0A7R9PTZ0_9ACAR|nr:unnamed protein product [Medioppia subpectinata]CAG2101065.1 unnamed protein product [Medioppia subpectinata]
MHLSTYLRRRFTYWTRNGVPGANYPEYEAFIGVHHECTVESIKKYGRVYGTYTGFRRSIVINEPDLLRDIMVKDFNVFPDHKHFHMGSSKLDKSLFFMPGDDDWKRVRSILSPVFTSGKLRAMMAHIGGISDGLVHSLSEFEKNGKPVDMRKYIGAFAMDVISACAYGINPQSISNPDHPIVTNAKSILGLDAGVNQIFSVLTPALARFLNLEPFPVKAVDYFDDLTNQILKERKVNNKYIIVNNNKHKKRTDFIQLMIDSEKSDKESGYYSGSEPEVDDEPSGGQLPKKVVGTLTPDELTAQGILFFIAGYDTTSAALTHAIHYLSKHPDCQQILYEELRSCDEFTYEKLSQLKYLNAVINETLRLAPSLTRIQRECIQDYKLGNTGITVPAGTSVEIYPYAIQRDPDFWPNPNDFIPDRFLNPVHHPYAYLPFGGGPRICIGQRFALQEMRMCLAKLVNQFEFIAYNKTKIEYFTGNILMSPKELLVNIKSRI